MIRRAASVQGLYAETIPGQKRYACAVTDSSDLYDLTEWREHGGYQGSVLIFYDLQTGAVYQPLEKKRDMICGRPIFADGAFSFLTADDQAHTVTLYRYLPETEPEVITVLPMAEVDLYNLRLIGEHVHIVSENRCFACYWPERMSFEKDSHETAVLITEDKVYLEAWVEEGWDEERHCASDDYRYYHKTVVRDSDGRVLKEENGALFQTPEGDWWIL